MVWGRGPSCSSSWMSSRRWMQPWQSLQIYEQTSCRAQPTPGRPACHMHCLWDGNEVCTQVPFVFWNSQHLQKIRVVGFARQQLFNWEHCTCKKNLTDLSSEPRQNNVSKMWVQIGKFGFYKLVAQLLLFKWSLMQWKTTKTATVYVLPANKKQSAEESFYWKLIRSLCEGNSNLLWENG